SSAFDGLAIGEEDEAAIDAFSLLPPPDANDPMFANEQHPPSGGHAASSGASVPQRAARPAVPQRPAPARQPDAPQLPDGPAPQPPRKRRKWKFFGMIVMALSIGAAGLAWQQWPYRVRAVGQLSFDGLDQLPPEQRRQAVAQSAKLDPGDVAIRMGAIALCSAQNVKPGFLDDAVAVDAIARSARFDGASLHLERVGRDESDRARMAALLSSLYEANRFLQDRAQSNQRRQEEINRQLQENKSASDSLAFRQKVSEDRARAAHAAQLASEKLAAREQTLRVATQKVSELEQTAKGPAAPTAPTPVSADADPQLIDLAHQLKRVEARIALAHNAGGDADKVNEALATAIGAQLKQIVDAQSSRPPDSPIAGYLSVVASATSAMHNAAADFIAQQKSAMDSLAELHREEARKSQARLQGLFAGDSQLVGLQQKWAIKDRQANTATDANLVAQATRFRGEADALHKQIDQRRTELAAGIPPDADQNLADSVTAKMREQQEAFAQRLAEASKTISQAMPDRELLAPADRLVTSRVDQQAILVEAAAQQLAASLDMQPDPAAAVQKLEAQRGALQVAAGDRRKQLDQQAEDATVARQKQVAGVGMANALLGRAQDDLAKATEERDAAKAAAMDADQAIAKLPPAVIDQAADNLRISQLDEQSKQLKSELARLNTYPLIAPRDPARSADAVQIESLDPLPRIATSSAIVLVGLLLCGLMFWLNGSGSRASADSMELAQQHQLAM
ncbi:MAG TPA: hypothetical protein VH370_16795, partial [Humisphaera sp.]|nr:hypothetical protein [Humisphaera sp.]